MTVSAQEWLKILEREYLAGFITAGGATVKFVVGDDALLASVQDRLGEASKRHNLAFICVDAAHARLHMIQDVFFAVARAVDWNVLARHFVEALFIENRYIWPEPGSPISMLDLAAANRIDVTLLRREINRWLTRKIMNDNGMTQDFRVAMTQLCLLQMETPSAGATLEAPIGQWLIGKLSAISALKSAPITAKITRYNGRAMLRSACQWLRKCRKHGLSLTLDIRQLGRTAKSGDGHVHYSPGAVMDGFEVLRQLIDEAEHFAGMQLVILADETLAGDDKSRSLNAYLALKWRVWDDVRAEGHDNPLAPLVRLAASSLTASGTCEAQPLSTEKTLEARMAIEALRAGVPNRSAIRLLASADNSLAQEFQKRLLACQRGLHDDRPADGIIISGAFGAGKSHQLGYLAERARQENWIISLLPISKETPLFDPAKVFAAAVRTAIVPDANDDVMTAAMQRLGKRRDDYDQLERWTTEEVRSGRLAALFAALLWLIPKGNVQPDGLARIARFFGGAKLNQSEVKRWLKEAGASKLFPLSPVRAGDLVPQRLRFAPRLLAAAGFTGWCILLDEVELIGRYSPLQRGKSYSELARWLGMDEKIGIPGLLTVAAITKDFSDAMFDKKGDDEKIPPLLEQHGLTQQATLARQAIVRLKREDYRLHSPDEEYLRLTLSKVRLLYRDAYVWNPPATEVTPPEATKFMRQYVKSWIVAWDIQRLYGEGSQIAIEPLGPDYTGSSGLAQRPDADESEE